jgi:glycosyltransferase AglI
MPKTMKHEISVVIPVYNDAKGIKTTLASLVKQDYPEGKYEVIVVDNNSGDNTPRVVEQFCRKYPGTVKLCYERDTQSSYAARNRGIERAQGDILCFMDSDMWADKDWLSRVGEVFENENVDYLGCSIEIIPLKNNMFARFHKVTGFPAKSYMFSLHFAVTAALAVRKDIFEKVGLFDERLISGGDREFGNRVYDAGYKQHFSEDIKVYHPAFSTMRQIRKKYFRVGRGLSQLYFYYPARYPEYDFSVFSPGLYLSKNPLKTGKTYSRWSTVSKKERLIFYGLLCVKKISQVLGYLYEKGKR